MTPDRLYTRRQILQAGIAGAGLTAAIVATNRIPGIDVSRTSEADLFHRAHPEIWDNAVQVGVEGGNLHSGSIACTIRVGGRDYLAGVTTDRLLDEQKAIFGENLGENSSDLMPNIHFKRPQFNAVLNTNSKTLVRRLDTWGEGTGIAMFVTNPNHELRGYSGNKILDGDLWEQSWHNTDDYMGPSYFGINSETGGIEFARGTKLLGAWFRTEGHVDDSERLLPFENEGRILKAERRENDPRESALTTKAIYTPSVPFGHEGAGVYAQKGFLGNATLIGVVGGHPDLRTPEARQNWGADLNEGLQVVPVTGLYRNYFNEAVSMAKELHQQGY